MDSRLADGLQQTHVSVKSAHEAWTVAPQLTSPMLAFSPHHEKNERGEAILAPSRFTLQRGARGQTYEALGGQWSDGRGAGPVRPFHGAVVLRLIRGKTNSRMLRCWS